jgi:glutamyl endopeptidase
VYREPEAPNQSVNSQQQKRRSLKSYRRIHRIGTDTRFRTYTNAFPARAIALITFSRGYCTGWFYGPNVVATAGHCVHSGGSGGTWRTNVRVYPGYNAGSAPYGSYPAKWLASVAGWTQNADERYDYGVVKLSTNVGNTVGWFGFWWQSGSLRGLPAVIAGYPGDKSPTQSQWIGTDQVRVMQERQVFYKNDTFGGQSGSAVWHDRPAGSSFCANGPCAYAIHAYGLHGSAPHSDHNHGTRIVQAVFDNLVAWRNAPGIAGQITDSRGRPVAGAFVQPRALDDPSPPIPEIAIVSDGDGRYTWRLFPGTYEISVSAEGYRGVSRQATVKPRQQVTIDFMLERAQ